ncbi:hypothetical protein RA307_28500 [Xanthobacteraceae bacterium Astr-EGSB]|uniref:hypothetical protein n=1 Tax=Astrobacterium formosum TaxID=3069710 RepID=UPI0027AE65F4|nr:hypothetical protein [Xanthobacteraceae bacterium Astr-EGSB]
MLKYMCAAATLATFVNVTVAIAQTDCSMVLTRALREYDIQSDSSAYLNSTFDNLCTASGETRNRTIDIGVEAVIKAIPIKFTGGATDVRTAATNFCKTYKADTTATSTSSRYRETVAQRAYQSFDNCVSLSQQGNLVTHEVLSIEKVQIFLRAGIAKPVELRGVDMTQNIKCSGAVDGKLVTYSQDTSAQTDKSMTINCTRAPRQMAGGEMVFDEGTIALDIALGRYAIFLPRDTKLSEDQASILNTTISELRSNLDRVDRRQLACFRAEAQSPMGRNQSVEASIPSEHRSNSIVTGGGCEIPAFYGHYPPITISKPTAIGWTCTANDPPGIPLNLAVKAHVIYCRVAEK